MAPPIITQLSPSSGWPGGVAADGTTRQGTLVIIHGRHFHPTPEMHRNQVSFANTSDGRVPAPVEWASPDETDYQPDRVVARDTTVPGGLDGPRGMAVSPTGDLYIADTEQHRIVRMTPSDNFSSWGSNGGGPGQFDRPTGIAVDQNGYVYIADTMNHRIQKFDANGKFVTAWGSYGAGLGQFDMPVDVDVTVLGDQTFVYVADSNNHRVARTDGNGGMPTQLLTPVDSGRILAVCAPRGYGSVYATDSAKRRIHRWAWNGIYNGCYGAPSPHTIAVVDLDFPMGIEQDSDGFVYVVDNGARVVRKFDPFAPDFRQIAQFGLTIPTVPSPTPDVEFVDPVDITVTDLKAAYVVDRGQKKVVRYIPTDSEELWVRVPEGAASGMLQVRTDEGTTSKQFLIWPRGGVEIADAYLTQGVWEYPLVAGKKTVIRCQLRTVGETSFGNYHWGSPVHDTASCHVIRNGSEIGQVEGRSEFITGSGGFMGFQIGCEIHFDIPPWLVNEEGEYRFEVRLDRTGTPSFHYTHDFAGTFRNRRSYRVVSTKITHLKPDGTRLEQGPLKPVLYYIGGDPQHYVDWLDWAQLYSGYYHFNRLYPMRHSVASIVDSGIWPNETMANGINDKEEVVDILEVLERRRRQLNEDSGASYDFILGIVDRREVHMNWAGVGSSCCGSSVLISVGDDPAGDPAYDVGSIIGHELLHLHAVEHQTMRERIQSAKQPWNPATNTFVEDPVTLMWESPTDGPRSTEWNDDVSFVEGPVDGSPGNYNLLYDALANPHPTRYRRREQAIAPGSEGRPPNAECNFNLIGKLSTSGEFTRSASWIGAGTTPVTPQFEGSQDWLVFLDSTGTELLRWSLEVSFGLMVLPKQGPPSRLAEDTAILSLTVPFPDETRRIELVVAERTVWSVDVPTEGPIVRLITPRGDHHIGPDDTLHVQWEASHPQDASLEYAIEYSFDGGKTFHPLVCDLVETQYELQSRCLAASTGQVQLRVVASDEFNKATDTSDDIQVEEGVHRHVVIIQPRWGEIIPEGKTIRMTAMASDTEQGFVQLNYANTRWLLDGEVVLGGGNEIDFQQIELDTPRGVLSTPLPVGEHRLRVDVTVAPGEVISDEIPIEIAADSDRDGVPDDIEIERGTSPTDPSDGATLAPVYPFGQWQFWRHRTHTVFQLSHLGTGQVVVGLSLINESGAPLANHPLRVVEDDSGQTAVTDNDGHVRIRLQSRQTVLLTLSAHGRRRRSFGFCTLRVAKDSPITDTYVQARAWIHRRRGWWLLGWESQGTVEINGGKPLRIRGAKGWSGTSPRMAVPSVGYRLLGRLQMAAHSESKMIQEQKIT